MTDLKQHWVLVEGPAPGDAQFLGRWLLEAARADKLLRELFEQDPEFKRSVARIELLYAFAFSPAGYQVYPALDEGSYLVFVVSL